MATTKVQDLEGPAQTRFFTKQWLPQGPPRAALLFVHGFIERIERYDHVFPKYAEQGIAVFAYDQRGFGKTATYTPKHTQGVTSWREQFGDIDHFLEHTLSLFPNVPLFLYGHSMGGALVLGYATRTPPQRLVGRLAGIISSSPLLRQSKDVRAPALVVRAGSLLGKLSATLTLKATVTPEHTCRDPVIQKEYAEDPLCKQIGTFRGVADMLLGGEAIVSKDYKRFPKDLPLLVVHGEADKVTDCDSSREFVDKVQKEVGATDTTFRGFPGFYHEMHNEPGDDKWTEINYLLDWLNTHIPSATSTAAALSATATSTAAAPAPSTAVAADDAEASAAAQAGAERESKL
ncbi:Alpha/Beta hydrolase protein [Rhodotorula diobovata]|uniref:Alpha/Beta hydrolase protein n=1 Tax=Rhodotorula diobovata TaxID=5288 RepID=A0A5C5FUE6_9BASI|nr:Alpha/Beta hydrolase protein [Rhodotorula diobovata]